MENCSAGQIWVLNSRKAEMHTQFYWLYWLGTWVTCSQKALANIWDAMKDVKKILVILVILAFLVKYLFVWQLQKNTCGI